MSGALEGEIVQHSAPVNLTKHDEKIVQQLEAAFNSDFTIEQACYYAGISRQTFYNWLADDDVFSFRMSVAQAAPMQKAKENVYKAIQEGDPNISLRVLTLRDPTYKPKAVVETPPDVKETRDNLKGVLDAISQHDPGVEPPTADGPNSPGVVEGNSTDISE